MEMQLDPQKFLKIVKTSTYLIITTRKLMVCGTFIN